MPEGALVMTGCQINVQPDNAAHVDTGRTWRNMEPHTDPLIFTSGGRWVINKPTAPVSARRDGAEAMILRTRTRTLRRSPRGHVGTTDAEPYAPCKDHRWGGPRKRQNCARTKSGSTSEKTCDTRRIRLPWVARPIKRCWRSGAARVSRRAGRAIVSLPALWEDSRPSDAGGYEGKPAGKPRLGSKGLALSARDDATEDEEYGRWLDEMVAALLPVSREAVAKLICVRKVVTRHWGVPVQRSF